jgi:hypothetical protein
MKKTFLGLIMGVLLINSCINKEDFEFDNLDANLDGTYAVATTINATSDGLVKTSSNKWTLSYIDTTGDSSDWYKIRFGDSSSAFTDYSNEVTLTSDSTLSTIDDVKQYIDTVGRWDDEEVMKMITNVDSLIYNEFGTPLQQMICPIYTQVSSSFPEYLYFLGEEKVLRVDRVFIGTSSKIELYQETGYLADLNKGIVNIKPYSSTYYTSTGVPIQSDQDLNIQYVPDIFGKLSAVRTAKRLLQKADITASGDSSKELKVIQERLDEIETIIQNRYTLMTTTSAEHYDPIYGVNMHWIKQDFNRNKLYTNRWN